jgi:hypothetical protein
MSRWYYTGVIRFLPFLHSDSYVIIINRLYVAVLSIAVISVKCRRHQNRSFLKINFCRDQFSLQLVKCQICLIIVTHVQIVTLMNNIIREIAS